ncbi:Gfo/Idh/MocA family oxidoreductase [Bifidobacterium pullorum subsp. saeculare]|uniref:Gfo/Idh/MocA family oxidoreductase n=1 Tax=Bifidobacterium pullorum subsp. saeculare TaxID=78257 RepID=A0A938WWU7_9BIFI|nr:Gfo/Idh/MocA family oxidoreductase [Bifidobacterium pullorum]MBM6698744.1 Gfo/Idh/MocA family oxidoreductase [Bifidobacterium pullorum subsp. saeculare]
MSRLNGRRAEAEAQGLKVNVAILGAGRIAHAMAETLVRMAASPEYGNLVAPYAVAARDGERAAAFAEQYGFATSYGSYEELVADPDVDLVYIATPHNLHAEQAILCMRAGKNVLVEKSLTANAAQAREMLAVAEETGMLCTEAIWTRYMPSRGIIDGLIASGEIGEVKAVDANLCYPVSGKPRMTDPALAGGALLDVGVYPLNFIDMAVGSGRTLERVETSMTPWRPTGVDAQNSMTLFYDDGLMATAQSSMVVAADRGGYIWGTDGYLVCENINNVQWVDVYDADHTRTRRVEVPAQLTGYEYEVAATANAILDGKRECDAMPHADSLRIMELMDSIRAKWGLVYPFE